MDGLPSPTRAPDHWHVNIDQPWEVTLWMNELRCSEQELRKAVESVGPIAGPVRAFIYTLQREQRMT